MEFIYALAFLIVVLLAVGVALMLRRDPPPGPITQPTGQPLLYQQPPPPPKRGLLARPADWIALVVMVLVLFAWARSCSGGGGLIYAKIVYRVSGTATYASMTYNNDQGGMEQKEIYVPGEIGFNMSYGTTVSLLVQNSSGTGSVSCEVLKNGQPWLKSTSTAQYGIATCTGVVGY